MGSENAELPLEALTSSCSATLDHHSSSVQKVSNPNDKNEQSSEVLQNDHIRAKEELKIIRNSYRDECEQC